MPTEMNVCSYSPQISPGNSNVNPMPEDAPVTLVPQQTIVLEYPWDTPTITLTLKNPELNDKFVKKFTRIYRRSRGGTIIGYRDVTWPHQDILNWSFMGLPKADAEAALDFYRAAAGKYIKVTTYEGLVYKGIILNTNNPISEEGPGGCQYTLKFDFQGSRL